MSEKVVGVGESSPASPKREREKRRSKSPRDRKRRSSRSRSPDRKRRRSRTPDRDRERERDRDRDRERDREREKEREREREKERERERERDKEREKERERRRAEGERRRNERRRKEEEEDLDPEIQKAIEHERAQRTVYVWQVPRNITPKELIEFFGGFGLKVTDVKMITDRVTRKFKGIAYVELAELSNVPAAINLSGQLLRGRFPIMIKSSEAEKNFAAERAKAAMLPQGATRVQVSQLHHAMTDSDLKELFSSFGEVESVRLQKNDVNQSKGFGYVYFKLPEDAKNAVQHLNDFDFGGQKIKVTLLPHASSIDAASFAASGMNGRELDGIDGLNGLINNAESRASLMAKLQRDPVTAPSSASGANSLPLGNLISAIQATNPGLAEQMRMAGVPGFEPAQADTGPKIPTSTLPVVYSPSPCIVLKNMFDPDSEFKEDGFTYHDIEEDVKEECTVFGDVLHIHALPRSDGCVFLKFRTASAAQTARNNLNRRWFAGKQITAEFVDAAAYNTQFN